MELDFDTIEELRSDYAEKKQARLEQLKDEEFIVITNKMLKTGLDGKKLLVYALISNICTNSEKHSCQASQTYIATRANTNRDYVVKILQELVDEGYINKSDKLSEYGTCIYTLPDVEPEAIIVNEPEPIIADESETKAINIDNKKDVKTLLAYIRNLKDVTPEFKEILEKWYMQKVKAQLTVDALREKLKQLDNDCNGNIDKMTEVVKNSYVNGYFKFVVEQQSSNYKQKPSYIYNATPNPIISKPAELNYDEVF